MLISDRERIAIDAIPGAELSFEVRGPRIIGRRRVNGHGARMHDGPSAPAWPNECVPLEQIGDGTDSGPRAHARMSGREILHEFRRAPAGVRHARREEQRRHLVYSRSSD